VEKISVSAETLMPLQQKRAVSVMGTALDIKVFALKAV